MAVHAARSHSKLSPSSAHRWVHCAGSIRMSEGIETKSGIWADEGTAAHQLGELCLRAACDAADYLGGHVNIKTGKVLRNPGEGDGVFAIDDEMVDAVQLYVDTIRSLIEPGDEVEYEAKLDLTHIPGMGTGTGDCVIYKPARRHLIIADLKYGKGVPVDVNHNPQTRAYALGASRRFHNRGVDTIESVIVQPRCPHPEGSVRREAIDIVDLIEFRADIEAAAAATAAPDAPLNPGEWCRFCPAAFKCPALRARVQATAEMEFGEPTVVDTMTPEAVGAVLKEADVLKAWFKRVEERANEMAHAGNPPRDERGPWKLVANRATRRWKDDEATVKYLAAVVELTPEQIYTDPKLRSPAQVEKIIGTKRKSEISELVVSKSSGTILAPADDPRPSVKVAATEEFAA